MPKTKSASTTTVVMVIQSDLDAQIAPGGRPTDWFGYAGPRWTANDDRIAHVDPYAEQHRQGDEEQHREVDGVRACGVDIRPGGTCGPDEEGEQEVTDDGEHDPDREDPAEVVWLGGALRRQPLRLRRS